MDRTTLRWFLVLAGLIAYLFTAAHVSLTAGIVVATTKEVSRLEAQSNTQAQVEVLARGLNSRLREISAGLINTFSFLQATVSALLAALLAIEVVQPAPVGGKPFWRLTAFADDPWLAFGMIALFASWVVVSFWLSFEAISVSDDFSIILSSLPQVDEAHRSIATKIKGICDSVLNATIGTMAGALYAAFSVKPKEVEPPKPTEANDG